MNNQSLTLKLDLKIVTLILLAVIAGMLVAWRPWQNTASERKITTTGSAEIEAVPDEFVFYPNFERSSTDPEKAKEELNAFGRQLIADLQNLGVEENNITLDSSAYDRYDFASKPEPSNQTIILRTTVKASDKELAQKIQDYLAKTDAKGQLTPQPSFSETKQKELENQAREAAIEDAKSNAERTARTLGSRLGKVIEVTDSEKYSPIFPYTLDTTMRSEEASSLPITPGKQKVTFRVEVVFALR